jgi:hypothetical protein
MPFVTARIGSSTALILLLHKGISALRHAQTLKIDGGSGLRSAGRWLTSQWAPTWRAHRWVFLIWLLGVAALVAWILGVIASGFDNHVSLVSAPLAIALPWIHEGIVGAYERRTTRATTDQLSPESPLRSDR